MNQSDIIANDNRHRSTFFFFFRIYCNFPNFFCLILFTEDLTEMEADAETERNLVAAVRNCQREVCFLKTFSFSYHHIRIYNQHQFRKKCKFISSHRTN